MMTLTVNGQAHAIDADPATPLLYLLRDHLALNGAKFGCGLGQCGACTVVVDGKAVFSCLTPLSILEGRQITTLEGLGTAENPARFSARWVAPSGLLLRGDGRAQHIRPEPIQALHQLSLVSQGYIHMRRTWTIYTGRRNRAMVRLVPIAITRSARTAPAPGKASRRHQAPHG